MEIKQEPTLDGDRKVSKSKDAIKRKRKVKQEVDCPEDADVPVKKVKKEQSKSSLASVKEKEFKPVAWKTEEVLSACVEVPEWAARNVVKLLDEGCTVPFIARYRKEQTGDMEVQKLRESLTVLEELRTVEAKIKQAKMTISEQGKLTTQIDDALSHAQTLQEVECLYAPFKPGVKGTLAERARALGLEALALNFLSGAGKIKDTNAFVQMDGKTKGLSNVKEILNGVQHIIADIIHKDTDVMELVRKLSSHGAIQLQSSQVKSTNKKAETKPGVKVENPEKYQNYFNFSRGINTVQPHQVLAINRGENHKILTVKLVVPDFIKQQVIYLCNKKWFRQASASSDAGGVVKDSIEDAYTRLIQPQLTRTIRSQLTKAAEKASMAVFGSNLKSLLLQAPLKGQTILAIDPGFSHGCKMAVISETGQILDTDVCYIHSRKGDLTAEILKVEQMIKNNKVHVAAIGNGTACRETETFIAARIHTSFPHLKYCIVDECGASIYSVSDIAQKEMPNLDATLRGAVSIGRRLQDPLAELVKLDPKHLGVGQYQHDMPQNKLKSSLDSTVEECVSFVGVDLNTCSECLLSRLSGMTASRAKNVMEWRDKFGPFICREQLLSVKGLGAKTYEQAAGFVRVHSNMNGSDSETEKPTSLKQKKGPKGKSSKKEKEGYVPNRLDMTWIHPESYHLTDKFMYLAKLNIKALGTTGFIEDVKRYLKAHSLKDVASQLGCGEPTLSLITTALLRPLAYDLRDEFQKPLFKDSVKSMSSLKRGETVTGRVTNTTNFGAFVDIGVECNGLVHVSKMKIKNKPFSLQIGQKIEARVDNVEMDRKRIGLILENVL